MRMSSWHFVSSSKCLRQLNYLPGAIVLPLNYSCVVLACRDNCLIIAPCQITPILKQIFSIWLKEVVVHKLFLRLHCRLYNSLSFFSFYLSSNLTLIGQFTVLHKFLQLIDSNVFYFIFRQPLNNYIYILVICTLLYTVLY